MSVRRAVSGLLLAALMLAAAPGRAEAKWTSLRTENFLFVGDAAESRIREIAQRLEQFRDVMSAALPLAVVQSPAPTVVFVFQSDRSFTPYKPQFEGRPIDVAGFFRGGSDVNYVAINAGSGAPALQIVFHEYAHFITRNTTGELPVWASEGLAGVYETFEARDGGRSAMLGAPHLGHLALLQNSRLMPLTELLAVDHSSPIYNEGDRRGLLYAESWALMHYLMLGNPERAVQLRDYLSRLKDGAAPDVAFRGAFAGSPDDLERELRDYIRRFKFPAIRLDFSEKVLGSGAGRGQPMDDVDAGAYLADLVSRLGRLEDARAQLQKLVAANPRSARAVSTLGLLEFKSGTLDDALPLLERAALLDPTDAAVQQAWGRALFARAQDQALGDSAAAETMEKSRVVLNRAAVLSPDDSEMLMLLGRVESLVGDHARATALLTRAVALAPRDERYQLMLADSLVREEEYVRATAYLGPLANAGKDPDIQETARDLLEFVAKQVARAGAEAAAAPLPSGTPPPSSRRTDPGGRFVPEFRRVGAGERRVLGTFTTVDCRPGSAVLVIEADGETLRLAAESLARVEFIAYGGAASGTVGCGPVRPAPRVFATFREDDRPVAVSGVDGQAVAIELLPDDFTPQ